MSGQLNEIQLKARFLIMLKGFDAIEKGESHPKLILSTRYLNPVLNWDTEKWLNWYELGPLELLQSLATDILAIIGIREEDLNDDPNRIVKKMTDKLNELANINVDRETVLDLLSDKMAVVIIKFRCLLVMLVSQLRFKVPLTELIKSAKDGDPQSTIDLVKLDHTFLAASFVRRQVSKAELTNDQAFFKLLASALKPDPNFWHLKSKRRYLALWILHQVDDFAYRSDQEWSDFLAPLGFPKWEDPEVGLCQ